MKAGIRKLLLCADFTAVCSGCVTQSYVQKFDTDNSAAEENNVEHHSNVEWTDQALDAHVLNLLLKRYRPFENYRGISGRIVGLFQLIEADLKKRHNLNCGSNFYSDHLFFCHEDDDNIELALAPRSIPDSKNQIREFDDRAGDRKMAVTLLPGSRELEGCQVKYNFQKENSELIYLGEYR